MALVHGADAAQCPNELGRIERRSLRRFGAWHRQHFCAPSNPANIGVYVQDADVVTNRVKAQRWVCKTYKKAGISSRKWG